MTITLRRNKGTALTFDELDNNFSTLDGRTNNLNSLVSASLQGTTNVTAGTGIVLQPSVDATASSATIKLSKFLDASGQAAATATQYDVLTNVDLTATTASAGTTGIAYSSSTKTITYTPPDLTSFLTSSSSIDLSNQSLTGTLPTARLPNISLTSVTTVASQAAQLALTTEEGDVVIRSDENKSYIRNSGTADPHDMTNFSVLTTPDTDTTYAISVEQTDNTDTDPTLNLTPNQGSADTITIKGSGATTVTRTDSGESVTINTPAAPVTSVDGNTGVITTLQIGTTSTTALAGDTALLALGTTSTTALAGDTALLALGTSSTTALAGDTALLALGTTSTTALAGDTALLALGTSSTTALAGDTVVDNLLLEVAKSNTSLNIGDKSWIKVATVTIDARYQYYSAQLAVVGTGASEGVANEKVVAIRVKQQSSLSNAPLVEVTTYNNSNEDYDFGHVVAVNTVNETRVDIYFRADGPNSGAEIYRMAETATATVAWVTGFTADYVTSAPTNFVQGGVHEKWHSGNQAGIFGSLNGLLKANGSGVLSAAVAGTDYSTLALGTSSTTALAGDTALLALGTSSTTALAGDTTFAFADITSKPTTISGYGITDALAIGTSATTAMAGNTTFAFSDITSKPTTISGYGITDALAIGTSATTAMAGNTALSAIGGSLDLSSQVTGTLPVGNMSATALTTVQTAANQAAQLALTTQEGDVVVRTDENKTYMRNSGTADPHDMTNFTLLATPTDAVTSVDGNTGVVTTLQIGTSATTAMAGNTTFAFSDITSKPTTISGYGITDALAIGTSGTTAMAGNTTFAFADITSKPTTISGYGITDALAIGTTSTTALAGDTALLALGTTSTTALAGDTALLALGTTSTTALAGDTTFAFADITSKPTTISGYGITDALAIGTTSTTALAGDTALLALGTSSTTALAGDTALLALGTSSTTALAGNTTSFGGSASNISLGTHSGTGTQNINIGGAVIGGVNTNIKNIYIGNGANNGGATNVYIGPSSTTTTAQTTIYHGVDFEYGSVSFNGNNFTVNPSGSANTITLGSTTGTGAITIGRSTGSQTVDIAGGTHAGSKQATVNIAQGGGTRTVNIASDNISGSTTVVYAGNPSGTATSTILLRGNLSIDRPMYGSGATEYYDFFDHMGGVDALGSDGDWDISGTGLNALTEITIPATSHIGTMGKRGSLRMTCQSTFYNNSSTTKRNAEYYLGLQMKSKGTSSQSENLGVATFVSSPSQFNGLWSFPGNLTDKICAGFGALANNSSATGMTNGPAPINSVVYDSADNKTYIRVSSYYYYNTLGGSAVTAGNSTSFDVYYNPTEFKSTGTWVSSMRADTYGSRTRLTVQPTSTHQMHHAFNLSIPKDTSKTELRLIFDYSGSNTNLSAAVYAVEGTVMLEGSRV